MTDEKMLELARKNIKKAEENQNQQSSYQRDYDELHYMGLEDNKPLLVRMIGEYFNIPEESKSIYAPRIINRVKVLDDNDKWCYFNLPSIFDKEKPHIFWRIYNKVMAYKSQGKDKLYYNEKSHPTLFNRVFKNNLVYSEKTAKRWQYEKGWWPKSYILFQGINRLDYKWHQENKKYKLLTKKINVQNDNVYVEPGVPTGLWDTIFSNCVEGSGNYIHYDMFLLRKVTKGNGGTNDYSYLAYNAEKEDSRYPELNQYVVHGELTDEEKSWEKYDIKKLSQISTHTKILNRLGNFIKQVDEAFGTNFYGELKELSDKEKEQWEKDFPEQKKENVIETKSEEKVVNEEPKKVNRSVKIENEVETKPVEKKDIASVYPEYNKLSDKEKEIIVGINPANNNLIFNTNDSLVPCPECDGEQPMEIESRCIYCGAEFE